MRFGTLRLVLGWAQVRAKPFSMLSLSDNEIESLPHECIDLPEGVHLGLSCNPLVSPPANIAQHGWVRIKQWFADRRAQQRRSVDRLRVCFVGFGGAGKTTLARLLTDGAAATCGAVNAALPMRQWSSTQVDAWIRAAPNGATEAESRFLEKLADALADPDLAPDGEYLVEEIVKWDPAMVVTNTSTATGSAFTKLQVKRWWPRFCDRVFNHERKGYTSTIGIDVWEVELLVGEGQKLILEVVDFAGQMQFYTSHSLFFALNNAQYVLVSKAAPKGDGSESQIEEALYWLSFLRSSMARIRRHNAKDGDVTAVAQVLLAVTHTDKAEPSLPPDGLLHILGQRIDKLGQPANDPPRLARGQPCAPRYDDVGKADEARSMLIRALEAQVRLSHRCAPFVAATCFDGPCRVWLGACHSQCCAGRWPIGVRGGCLCPERGAGHRRGSEKG